MFSRLHNTFSLTSMLSLLSATMFFIALRYLALRVSGSLNARRKFLNLQARSVVRSHDLP